MMTAALAASGPASIQGDCAAAVDDADDIIAAQEGDGAALVRLIERHERLLNNYLLRFTRNEAALQDLRQETYVEVIRSIGGYRREGSFWSWQRKIASRVGYRYWSRRAYESEARGCYVELVKCASIRLGDARAEENHDAALVMLGRFSGYDRRILEMRYLDGLKASEIAQKIGWNVERVRVRLHRAIGKLRRMYGGAIG
jgi:RNA polymerase sigma-70 factor (ECF subfamily)